MTHMVQFETTCKHETEYGNGNFLEVARKVARDQEGATEFLSITRGYRTRDGDRRFKMHLTLPVDDDVVAFLVNAVTEAMNPGEAQFVTGDEIAPAPAPATA